MRRALRPSPVAVVAALIILAASTAMAHVDHKRVTIQPAQGERSVEFRMNGTQATIELVAKFDPLRHLVVHEVAPSLGRIAVEYREDPPSTSTAYRIVWDLERFLEYRDGNGDGRYQPGEVVTRSWRFESARWNASPEQAVSLGGVRGKSVTWTGNHTGGPTFRLEAAAAGREFVDEGARVRPQDLAVYLDLTGVPRRTPGALYAIEATLEAPADASIRLELTETSQTYGVVVDRPTRSALLLWGAEARLDGNETALWGTLGPATEAEGRRTMPVHLHLPGFETEAHFLVVSAVEYEVPRERQPLPALPLLLLALIGAALLVRARR